MADDDLAILLSGLGPKGETLARARGWMNRPDPAAGARQWAQGYALPAAPAPAPEMFAPGTRAMNDAGQTIELGADGEWRDVTDPASLMLSAQPGKFDGLPEQSYIDTYPAPLADLIGIDPATSAAIGTRNIVTGLARLPWDIASLFGSDYAERQSEYIGRSIPRIRTKRPGDEIGGALVQYGVPGAAAYGAATKAAAALPTIARMAAGGVAADLSDQAVTDPSTANTLGDLLGGPTAIQPGDTAMDKRSKVGAEGGVLTGLADALLRGIAALRRPPVPPEPGTGLSAPLGPRQDGPIPGPGPEFTARAERDARTGEAGARYARQTEDDILREFAERQAREQAGPQPGAQQGTRDDFQAASEKYRGAKFSPKSADPLDDGWAVDEWGHILSDVGTPVRFGDQKQAARWILNVGNKHGSRQVYELANHPSGGFTVRVRGLREEEATAGARAADDTQPSRGAQEAPRQPEQPQGAPRGGALDVTIGRQPEATVARSEARPQAREVPPAGGAAGRTAERALTMDDYRAVTSPLPETRGQPLPETAEPALGTTSPARMMGDVVGPMQEGRAARVMGYGQDRNPYRRTLNQPGRQSRGESDDNKLRELASNWDSGWVSGAHGPRGRIGDNWPAERDAIDYANGNMDRETRRLYEQVSAWREIGEEAKKILREQEDWLLSTQGISMEEARALPKRKQDALQKKWAEHVAAERVANDATTDATPAALPNAAGESAGNRAPSADDLDIPDFLRRQKKAPAQPVERPAEQPARPVESAPDGGGRQPPDEPPAGRVGTDSPEPPEKPKRTGPDITRLSGRKLRELIDKRFEASSATTKELIQAGHGMKRGSEIEEMAKAGDPLAIKDRRAHEAYFEATSELERRKRWGGDDRPIPDPDAPKRPRRRGGSTTLSANPFLAPRVLREAAPEIIAALVSGVQGHYEETGQIGISLKWALAGALAMYGARSVPFRVGAGNPRRPLVGKDSHAAAGARAIGARMSEGPVGRAFHPTGGIMPDLYDKLGQMRTAARNWQQDAIGMAKWTRENFTQAERNLMSDWIEKVDFPDAQGNVNAGGFAAADQRVKDAADAMARWAEDIGQRLVNLGMLDPTAYGNLRGTYLHRYYAAGGSMKVSARMREKISGSWGKRRGEMKLIEQPTGPRAVKEGDTLWQMTHAGSGRVRYAGAAQAAKLEQQGWVRGKEWKVDKMLSGGKMALWRDYTPFERRAMGEIRDAAYRFARGSMEAANDLTLGQMFAEIAQDARWAVGRSQYNPVQHEGWKLVPDSTVAGTKIRQYGKLAGMYVNPDVWEALKLARGPWTPTQSEALNEIGRSYKRLLALWKIGKTAFNPATHFNNIMGNVGMALLSGDVGPADMYRALKAMRAKDPMIEEGKRAGLSIGQQADIGDELRSLEKELAAATGQDARTGWARFVSYVGDGKIVRLYQSEDSIFKVASYLKHRAAGETPEQAVKSAHEWFFDYQDVPQGIKIIRDTYSPFITYPYKAAMALGDLAVEKPWRIIAAFGVLSGFNMLSYGDLYPDAPGAREDYERHVLPRWMKGRSAMGAPRALRLPWNIDDKARPGEERGLFINSRYFTPGGDILDWTSNAEFGPDIWPQVLGGTPLGGNPIPQILYGLMADQDPFFGKDISPYPNTDLMDPKAPAWQKLENIKATAKWMSYQVLPPTATWTLDKLGEAAVGEGVMDADDGLASFMDWTGTDFAGRQLSIERALMQTFGLKVDDVNPEEQADYQDWKNRKAVREAKTERYRARRNDSVSQDTRDDRQQAVRDARERRRSDREEIDRLREAAGAR